MMLRRASSVVLVAGLALLLLVARAAAHNERPCTSPPRPGSLPDPNRNNAHRLVVCKPSSKPTKAEHADIHARLASATGAAFAQAQAEETAWHRNNRLFRKCRFEHIQEAATAAADDTDILVLPGVYREEPSRAAPTSCNSCGDNSDHTFSYEFQAAHPNDQNLVGIIGKKNITLEGTGASPEDVLIDVGFVKDVGVRCDRCEGFIVRNLSEQDANEHGIYVIESDGYIFDRTIGRYNKEYELFSFASDHGLYTDCEALGGSDSGVYVGGAPNTCGPNTEGRINTVVRRCKMHHNALGFSGTQGNCVELTENDIYDNSIGISFDSEQDHPNFPMNHCMIVDNDIHDNNLDIYAPPADPAQNVPPGGPAYDTLHYFVGTGLWMIGGQSCLLMGNRIWSNECYGAMLFPNPLETGPNGAATTDGNMHVGNVMGAPAGGANGTMCGAPGADFFWEGSGTNNCWQDNGVVTTDPGPPRGLPDCSLPNVGVDDPENAALLASCVVVDSSTGQTAGPCAWGTMNDNHDYLNGDEHQCGNGQIDAGEDCDQDQYGGGSFVPGETCDSLGHGPGTLACTTTPRACTWDTSACAAPACAEYGASLTRLENLAAPGTDDTLRFSARNFPGAAFDPLTEDVSFVLRDEGGSILTAAIPGGSPGWTATATSYSYSDPAGALGGIVSIFLRATPTFATGFRAVVKVQGRDLGAAADATIATAGLRVGNDCWSDTIPCTPHTPDLLCRGRSQP